MSDERFWAKVKKSDRCWEWTGGTGDGYGRLARSVGGKVTFYSAHRYAYEQTNGPVRDGLYVRHLCHNRKCVRPEHLKPGTAAENCADTARAGRARNQYTGKLFVEPMPLDFFRWCAGGVA